MLTQIQILINNNPNAKLIVEFMASDVGESTSSFIEFLAGGSAIFSAGVNFDNLLAGANKFLSCQTGGELSLQVDDDKLKLIEQNQDRVIVTQITDDNKHIISDKISDIKHREM